MCNIDLKHLIFEDIISRGQFGTVYKGLHSSTRVAIKSIYFGKSSATDIVREMLAMKQMSHENIINVKGFCQENHTFHLMLEYVNGYDSDSINDKLWIKKLYNLTLLQKHAIAKQLCLAINYLHTPTHKFIHRDMKPENLLIDLEIKGPKLCDFGLIKIQEKIDSYLCT